MYYKYYKKHTYLFILGILLMVCSYIFDFAGILFVGLTIHTLLQILAAIFFALTMFYYYKIICVLRKVSDVTGLQVFIAVLSHTMTLISLYIFGNHMAFYVLFLGSILIRSVMGITTIDRQMKSLCKELDTRFFIIGKEQGL